MNPKIFKKSLLAVYLLALIAFALTGCQPQAAATEQMEGEHETDQEHEHESDRLPNDGAVIRIISPSDGATFMKGEDIVIEVEVENFELSTEGSHWHLYVDGNTWSQVVGGGERKKSSAAWNPANITLKRTWAFPPMKNSKRGIRLWSR